MPYDFFLVYYQCTKNIYEPYKNSYYEKYKIYLGLNNKTRSLTNRFINK